MTPGAGDSHHRRCVQVDGCRVALHERAGRIDAFGPIVAPRDIDVLWLVALDGNAHVITVANHAVRRGFQRLDLDFRQALEARASI